MKKIILLISLVIPLTMVAQIAIGMRDNRFINVNYTLNDKYYFELEQSIYSEKLPCQYIRAYAGYKGLCLSALDYSVIAYYGMAWNNNYQSLGVNGSASYLYKRIGAYASVNPHYDSFYGFDLCYRVGLQGVLSDQLSLRCDYNTIPTYRECENRLRIGLGFKVDNLYLEPMLSLPVNGNDKFKQWRVQVSFNYSFATSR